MHRYPALLVLSIYVGILLIWGPRPNKHIPITQEHYTVEITNDGQNKGKTIQYPVNILGYYNTRDSMWVPCSVSGQIYFSLDSLEKPPSMGDNLMCHMAFHPIYHTGICYIHQYQKLPAKALTWDTKIRQTIHKQFKELGFNGDTLGIAEALSIGQKTMVSHIQKQHFSATGVSHVLALSGLHVGLLAGIFLWRERYDKRRSRRWMRFIFMVGTLAAFTVIAGGAASLCRAVLLITLFYIGKILYKQITPVNILASVALGLLLYMPTWLFDLGFQLSMLAVLGLFILYPSIHSLLSFKTIIGKRVWEFTAVTLSAQLMTLPLTLPIFHTIPIYSPISNLLVLPQLGLLLYSLMSMIICGGIHPVATILAYLVKTQIGLLLQTINWIHQWPKGVWSIHMHPLESIPWIIAVLWSAYVLRKRTWLQAKLWLVYVLILLSAHYILYRV